MIAAAMIVIGDKMFSTSVSPPVGIPLGAALGLLAGLLGFDMQSLFRTMNPMMVLGTVGLVVGGWVGAAVGGVLALSAGFSRPPSAEEQRRADDFAAF